MISNTSIWIVRYLAPILFLTSIFLSVFSFVGPVPRFHSSVSLITVAPMNITNGHVITSRKFLDADLPEGVEGRRVPRAAALAQVLAAKVDGPTVLIGALGSCAKKNNGGKLSCIQATWSPAYDYSFLPGNAPKSALPTTVPSTTPMFYLTSLILAVLFFVLSTLASLADILPKAPAFLTKLNTNGLASRAIASIGLLAFVFGILSSIVWRISFGRDVDEFNTRIAEANGNPALYASLANGFTMMWVSYAFQAPALICALFKLHTQAIVAEAAAKE